MSGVNPAQDFLYAILYYYAFDIRLPNLHGILTPYKG